MARTVSVPKTDEWINEFFFYEDRVKQQMANDIRSVDMYYALRDLAETILLLKSMANTREDIDWVAHRCATRLWNKLQTGWVVEAWTHYITLNIRNDISALVSDKRDISSIYFVIEDPVELIEFVNNGLGGSLYDNIEDYKSIDFINSMSQIILQEVKLASRYNNPLLIRDTYLSVLSMIRGYDYRVGDQSETYLLYVEGRVRKRLYKEIITKSNRDNMTDRTQMMIASASRSYNYESE